jgi:N-acetylneuraminate synthase
VKTKVIAEIGINHNGSIDTAKKLIDVAALAGCDYVKFQKRNPELCVPDHQKNKLKSTPWGEMTYLDYKYKIEFNHDQFEQVFDYCDSKKIKCFASVWDIDSVDFMFKYIDIAKIPSALITNLDLCEYARQKNEELLISTGMSTEEEIERCVAACSPDVIFHTNSTYPSPVSELNLSYITWLKDKYPYSIIGYSGHEFGLVPTFAAVVMGAKYIERHITLDRTMWGSDQMASVEPAGLIKMIKAIRDIEASVGEGGPRVLLEGEKSKRQSLRK